MLRVSNDAAADDDDDADNAALVVALVVVVVVVMMRPWWLLRYIAIIAIVINQNASNKANEPARSKSFISPLTQSILFLILISGTSSPSVSSTLP